MSGDTRNNTEKNAAIKIAYSGVEGAYACIAARKLFPDADLIASKSFDEAYERVVTGKCAYCVLPIENSYAGEVGRVSDLTFAGSLYINRVYPLPIRHNLLGVKGAQIGDIRKVLSHQQALEQCAGYIEKRGYEIEISGNTAFAARDVAAAGDKSIAAIASAETAELYGLDILDHDINESDVNTTRFAVFSREEEPYDKDGGNCFILLFTVKHEVGALAKAVNTICSHGFNMSVLRSRPVKNTPWQYYFYVELEGDHRSEEGVSMLNELSLSCAKLKVAGHYKK